MSKNKFYAVVKGRETGIFQDWNHVKTLIDKFPGAIYKGFSNEDEAIVWYNAQTGNGPAVQGDKIYAVAKGRCPSIYYQWKDAQEQIIGFSGAVYKSFPNTREGHEQAAQFLAQYLSENEIKNIINHSQNEQEYSKPYQVYLWSIEKSKEANVLVAYVDGSYRKKDSGTIYSGSAIIVENGVVVDRLWLYGDNPEMGKMNNVSGEILGASKAVEYVLKHRNDIQTLVIIHDYLGISEWVSGAWECKNIFTQKYRDYVRRAQNKINIEFVHVDGHQGNPFNEEADKLCGYVSECIKNNNEVDMDYFVNHLSYVNKKEIE